MTGSGLKQKVARLRQASAPHAHRPLVGYLKAMGTSAGVTAALGGLVREMQSLHRTRLDTLRHATDSALANHLRRTAELETEYLARHPGREVDPSRLRDA